MASSLSPSQWGARTRRPTAVTGGELTPIQVRAARERIADAIVNTPCTLSLAFGELVPGQLHVKLENLQRTGSFKERGSLNKLLQLTSEERRRGATTRLESEEGHVMIHAFDNLDVMAGQGTVGLEIGEQVTGVDLMVTAVGCGGGLISGVAVALKAVRPEVRMVGVESAAAASARASRDAGRVVGIENIDTIADRIATKRVGELTFAYMERWVDDLWS